MNEKRKEKEADRPREQKYQHSVQNVQKKKEFLSRNNNKKQKYSQTDEKVAISYGKQKLKEEKENFVVTSMPVKVAPSMKYDVGH